MWYTMIFLSTTVGPIQYRWYRVGWTIERIPFLAQERLYNYRGFIFLVTQIHKKIHTNRNKHKIHTKIEPKSKAKQETLKKKAFTLAIQARNPLFIISLVENSTHFWNQDTRPLRYLGWILKTLSKWALSRLPRLTTLARNQTQRAMDKLVPRWFHGDFATTDGLVLLRL